MKNNGWHRWLMVVQALLCISTVACAQRSSRFQYYFFEAEKMRAADEWSAAHDLYRHCLEIEPEAPEALYIMGFLQAGLHNDSLSRDYIERAVRGDSLNVWYLTTLASFYIEHRQMDEAVGVLERLSMLEPNNEDVLYNLTELYKSLGRTEDALKVLEREELLSGKSIRLSMEKFQLYVDLDRLEDGFDEMKSLCDEYPNDPTCRLLLADQYVDAEQYDKAWAIYEKEMQNDAANVRLQMSLLYYYDKMGMDEPYEVLRDSLLYGDKIDDNLRTYLVHDFVQRKSADSTGVDECFMMLEKVMACAPESAGIDDIFARYVYFLPETDPRRLNYMNLILQHNPNNNMALYALLQHYAEEGDFDRLEDIARRGVNAYPEEQFYHLYLGISLHQKKQYKEAIDVFRAGICQQTEDTSPNMLGRLYSLLGDAYYELKQERQAYEAYDSALVYNPDDAMCLNNYAYYLSLHNEQLDKAEEMSYKAVRKEPKNRTYLDTYAWVLFVRGEFTEAKAYMDRVVNPSLTDEELLADDDLSGGVLEHAGDIAWKCGDKETALRMWGLALESNDETATSALPRKVKQKKYIK